MIIVLRCVGCNNRAIVSENCSGYCDKCHIQLQYDRILTEELCGKENEKERRRLEKLVNKKIKPKKKHKKKKI
jgi:RecJ-like exonuclease